MVCGYFSFVSTTREELSIPCYLNFMRKVRANPEGYGADKPRQDRHTHTGWELIRGKGERNNMRVNIAGP